MTTNQINTHPVLQSFLENVIAQPFMKRVENEESFHDHRERIAKSACCRDQTYWIDTDQFCCTCGNLTDTY